MFVYMRRINIGIIGTAQIAENRFIPSIRGYKNANYYGIASRTIENAERFSKKNGGKVFDSYEALLKDEDIDCVYIPLPPSLHFEWAKKALEYGKHVLLEKPFVLDKTQTRELVNLAKQKNLALHENYMFTQHKQLKRVENLLEERAAGEVYYVCVRFCFPRRAEGDFRYNKELGGGALNDCGGYTIKLVTELFGENADLQNAQFCMEKNIDISGNISFKSGKAAIQTFFGMDNDYRCDLEIIGSSGTIYAPRIFTAPSNFYAPVYLKKNGKTVKFFKYKDNQFLNSYKLFEKAITNIEIRENLYKKIITQSQFVDNARNYMEK